MIEIGFDLISDLNLTPDDKFDWADKATSLYCVIPGNISSDTSTILNTLNNLSNYYQGVFYIPGSLEYLNYNNIEKRTTELLKHCSRIKNVALLYHNVVIIDGIAILGCNGWYGNTLACEPIVQTQIDLARYEDMIYLKASVEKLQKHLDVKKVLMITNSVPNPKLFFGECPAELTGLMPLTMSLVSDFHNKVSDWAFGTYDKFVDVKIDKINFHNNACYKKNPYYAKIIKMSI